MAEVNARIAGDASGGIAEAVILLQRLVGTLVSQSKAVTVGVATRDERTIFTLSVASADHSAVSSPRTQASLECIVSALGKRTGLKYELVFAGR